MGGGGIALHMIFLFVGCFACQLRGQSHMLVMIIPLPHYENFAPIFFQVG